MRIAWIVALVAALSLIGVSTGDAKDQGAKGKNNKVKIDKPGKGPKQIPPGQIKRYTRGAKLPVDLKFDEIRDLSKWKLKPAGKGNRYIRVDNDILEVSEDLSTVVDAVGIVDDLLK